MAEENLKDFTINWILTGFLLTCLISFSTIFMFNNNIDGLGGNADTVFSDTYADIKTELLSSAYSSDELLNTTSNTNPESGNLGSRDIVSTSYSAKGSSTRYWETSKQLMGWVFSGASGKMLMSVFSGIIGFLSYFYISKHIRTGS